VAGSKTLLFKSAYASGYITYSLSTSPIFCDGLDGHPSFTKTWSEYKDSNLGPSGPKPDALPGCATLRIINESLDFHDTISTFSFILKLIACQDNITLFCIWYLSDPTINWLREKDLNLRPSGYEPDELPDCSIPPLIFINIFL
jgi:hypothetical protein